jgi:ATP-dependent DNA helicase RecQ
MNLVPLRLRLRRAARQYFGWDTLRPGQLPPMRALMKRRDVMVVLPTGGGKSAVYQLPGALLGGPTIVISPLLALQQDQIAALNARGDERLAAVRVSSVETPNQQRAALEAVRTGRAKFLFITPEQLVNPERLAEVRALRPALVAVDEAHCVSAWGYDFRPDYLQLGHLIRGLGRPPVAALTATASPPVRADIAAALGLRDPLVVVAGLDRPNLRLSAVHCVSDEQRWQRLLTQVQREQPPGIVYAPTRAATEQLAERLCEAGVSAAAFHAGLPAGERSRRYADFMADRVPVMVATSAFGMGVDKPNIRWVHHVALPDSPDSYLQEIGRAGRDGAPSNTVLLFRPEDVALQRFFATGAPQARELIELAATLREGTITKTALATRTGLPGRRLTQLISLLEQVGAVLIDPAGKLSVPRYAPAPAQAAEQALAQFERHQTLRRSRIDMMRQYAETGQCRGRTLLAYFGEQADHGCGHCDNCESGRAASASTAGKPEVKRVSWLSRLFAAAPEPADRSSVVAPVEPPGRPFPVSSAVRHNEWGSGTVMSYERDRMVVLFDEVGYKTLSVPIVREGALLVADST